MSARTVRELMSHNIITASPDSTLGEAVRLLDAYQISGLPVVDHDGDLVGVLSQSDVLRARVQEHAWSVLPGLAVRHVMSAPAVTVPASASIVEAAELMDSKRIHRLIVVAPDGRTPIGILSITDVIREMAARS